MHMQLYVLDQSRDKACNMNALKENSHCSPHCRFRQGSPTLEEQVVISGVFVVTSVLAKGLSISAHGLLSIHMEPRPSLSHNQSQLHAHRWAPGVNIPAVPAPQNLVAAGEMDVSAPQFKVGEKEPCQLKCSGARRSSRVQPAISDGSFPPHHHSRPGAPFRLLPMVLFEFFF